MARTKKTIQPRRESRSQTAAAEILDLTKPVYGKRSFTQSWQLKAWQMYEDIGECQAAANYMGDAFSNMRLFIGARTDDGNSITQLNPDMKELPEGFTPELIIRAQEILDQLNYPHSLSEIQRMAGVALFQVGEIYLVGRLNDDGVEEWDTYSTEQITTDSQGKYSIKDLPGDKEKTLNEDTDILIRLWRRSPRFSKLATSNIKGALTILEELLLLTLEVRATTMSRIPAGLVAFPNSMEIVQVDNTSDDPNTDGSISPMLDAFQKQFTTPITEPGHASAVAPFLIKGHKDDIEAIRVIEFGRQLSAESMSQRKECLERFINTINLNGEVLTGKANLNHWSAWFIDEDTANNYISPLVNVLTYGLTHKYLLPRLSLDSEGNPVVGEIPPFVIGFEQVSRIDDPQQAQEDKDNYDRFLISDEAMRKRKNISESEAPTPEEIAARILRKATVRETDSGGTAPPELPSAEVASGHLRSLDLAIKERELRLRLQVSADAAMHRALERTGARLRSLAQPNKNLKLEIQESGVSNELLLSQFGTKLLETLNQNPTDLVNDSFDNYGEQWDTQVAKAQKGIVALLGLTAHQQQLAMNRFDQAREQTKPLVVAGMVALATKLIFDPHPDAPELGEYETDMSVPAGLIRRSLMLAGGTAASLENTSQTDAAGLFTSDIAMDLYNESPIVTVNSDAFYWVHNDVDRPFEPHVELSGELFASDDDPALINNDSFPDADLYFPGDHDGCMCDKEPDISYSE